MGSPNSTEFGSGRGDGVDAAKQPKDWKFLTDTAWNYGAFALMAGTGVLINFFIAAFMGVEALGVFNQVFAIFLVTGQLAVLGLHDSAQKHAAEFADAPEVLSASATASVQAAFLVGSAVAVFLYLLSPAIAAVTNSEAVGAGAAIIAPGVAMFALNKTLLGVLNGMRRMREFAIGQSLRIVTILVVCFVVGLNDAPPEFLALSFTVAEAFVLVLLLIVVRPTLRRFDPEARTWVRNHLRFGVRALPNGFLNESFIRIDVIMLGIFVSDSVVGVYSFAAMFVEGLFQVPVVVRVVANPVLVPLVRDGDWRGLARFAKRIAAAGIVIFALAAAVALLILPYLAPFFPEGLVDQAYGLLFPLLGGLLIYAAFVPLDHILLQAGMPGRQSLLMSVNVICNIVLNAILIPEYGIWGAAYATATAFILSAVTLNIAAGRWLGMKRGVLFEKQD